MVTHFSPFSNTPPAPPGGPSPFSSKLSAVRQVQYIAGGATQNSVRVAQWMLHNEPDSTGFMGAIGADAFGEKLGACTKKDGVETHYFVDPETPTGTCAVLVNSENRSMVANLSAANKFDPAHLSTDRAKEMIESARFFYIAGFFLTVSVDAILGVAKHSMEKNKVWDEQPVRCHCVCFLCIFRACHVIAPVRRNEFHPCGYKAFSSQVWSLAIQSEVVAEMARMRLLLFPSFSQKWCTCPSLFLFPFSLPVLPVFVHPVRVQVMAMNLSAPFLMQFFGEQMATVLPYCDYVFGNESEAAAFGEKHSWGTDVSTVALKLAGNAMYSLAPTLRSHDAPKKGVL